MAAYPSYSEVKYRNPLTEELEFKTLINTFDNMGNEIRRRKWLYPKINLTLVYDYLTTAKAKTLYDFYLAMYGSYSAFNFFKHYLETRTNEYIGTGDGETTLYNLPFKTAASYSIYVDGAPKVVTTDFTYTSAGGADGADKIDFVSAPDEGARITTNFTGYHKIHCRFMEDRLPFERFYNKLVTTGIQLKGLLNE
jgi:hypothetical protein